MFERREVPAPDIAGLTAMIGPFALPFAMAQQGFAIYAEMTGAWCDLMFTPHENPSEDGAQLTMPEPLRTDDERELFA